MFKFNLGDEVQSMVSGFKGIVVGRVEYLSGCLQYSVVGRCTKDGTTPTVWIDEAHLKRTKARKVKVKLNPNAPGGPHDSPTRTTPPSR